MNENSINQLFLRDSSFNAIIAEVANSNMIVNIGTISKIHNENYADICLYYTDSSENDIIIQDVRLLKLGTSKVKVFIKPEEGDNVLLLCPRDFIEKLEFERKAEPKEFCQKPYPSEGMCGILIKDESDDEVKTTVTITPNGDITVDTKGEAFVTSKKIHLNGDEQNNNESHFVRYEELETAVNTFMNALNTHTHSGVVEGSGATGTPTPMEFDISEAKVPTVLTEKSSS